MRALALQILYLLRVHVTDAAPSEVWSAVDKLAGALRSERWPELGEDWKAVGLTRYWEDVTRAVRGAPGLKLRRYEILDAVSAAMKAVSGGRNADRSAAKADGVGDHRQNVREAIVAVKEACQILGAFEVPPLLLEPIQALMPEMPVNGGDISGHLDPS